VLIGLSAGLAFFFNKTDTGLAVLATSQEPVATELVGIGTRRMSTLIWVMAAVLGGIAGVLQGPDTIFQPFFMTSGFLLLAFGAAVVGGITSLSGALVGGQVIGIFSQLAIYFNNKFIKDSIEIPAFEQLLVFILLVTVLVVRPRGLLGTEA
jgi:branched-chain amino acid transport system permease protein